MEKPVTHNDRDIEIIMFKKTILEYLNEVFETSTDGSFQFGRHSCEDLCEMLLTTFRCSRVKVLEDNENGAVLYAN